MGTLTERAIKKVSKQFPFLEEITSYETNKQQGKLTKIKLDVKIADAEFLFCIPQSYYGFDRWWQSENRKFIGQFVSHGFAIDAQNKIIRGMTWGTTNNYTFFKSIIGNGVGVKTVVLLTDYIWNHYSADCKAKNGPIFDFSHYEKSVYIRKEPPQGFVKLVSESDLSKNVRITNLLAINGAAHSNRNPEAALAMRELDNISPIFTKKINNELWRIMDKNGDGGMMGTFGNTTLLTHLYIDYLRSEDTFDVCLTRGATKISFVASRRSLSHPGICKINCTIDEAKGLIQDVQDHWKDGQLVSKDIEPFW